MFSPNNGQMNVQQGQIQQTFFVNLNGGGKPSAINYPVAAGYEVFLLDEESKTFFIKKNNGVGISLREFKYEEVAQETAPQNAPANFDPSKYATKEDLNMILEELKKMQGGKERDRGRHYENRRSRRNRNDKQSYDVE